MTSCPLSSSTRNTLLQRPSLSFRRLWTDCAHVRSTTACFNALMSKGRYRSASSCASSCIQRLDVCRNNHSLSLSTEQLVCKVTRQSLVTGFQEREQKSFRMETPDIRQTPVG